MDFKSLFGFGKRNEKYVWKSRGYESPLNEKHEKRKERLKERENLGSEWYKNTRHILIGLLKKKKEEIDGLKFYTRNLAYNTTTANRIKVRDDGRFNVESSSTEYGEQWPGILDDNMGKGYTAKEIVSGNIYSLLSESITPRKGGYDADYRRRFIEEVKKKTGVDLRKEVKKIKPGNLEARMLAILSILSFIISILLSSNITGNVILNQSGKMQGVLGAFLFIFGLFLTFIYLKIR